MNVWEFCQYLAENEVKRFFSIFSDCRSFESSLKHAAVQNKVSVFTQRTDPSSAEQYFQVSACLKF